MLKSWRTKFAAFALTAALVPPAPAAAQHTPRPQESPWAMRPPTPAPKAAATLTAAQLAAMKEAEKGTPEQQALAHKVADAMYNKDFAALKQLIAPSTLKCLGKNQDFLEDRIRRQFALPINRKFQLSITKLPPNVMKATKYATYPMPPTHLMGMQFDTQDGTATVNLTIGQEGGKWYEAQPCPTELGMQRFAKLQHMRVERRERAKAAMANVKGPIKTQLLALIGKHDTVGAWKLCMSSLHYDFQTCHGIVELLSGGEGD
ncbi:MAG: hypothetical protein ACREQH_03105 [Candidatus Binatus sp.]